MKNELIIWKPSSPYTFLEQQIMKYGTYAEFSKVLNDAILRSFNMPKQIIQQDSSTNNYSSTRMDQQLWKHR